MAMLSQVPHFGVRAFQHWASEARCRWRSSGTGRHWSSFWGLCHHDVCPRNDVNIRSFAFTKPLKVFALRIQFQSSQANPTQSCMLHHDVDSNCFRVSGHRHNREDHFFSTDRRQAWLCLYESVKLALAHGVALALAG